jgi:hypothetical protein
LPDILVAELDRASCERRRWDAYMALLAARIKVLSDHELGYSGLAQSKGARTAEILVQQVTGLSKAESAAVVRVGSRAEFLDAVKPEDLGVAKVDAVRRGLGDATDAVGADDLRMAAERLAEDAPHLSVEDLGAHARAARDELDAQNIVDRERAQREARWFTLTRQADGMYFGRGQFDPESARIIIAATDGIIAPRRGGPRFVDKEKAAEQERLATEDKRTIPQMMVDALVDLVQVAVQTDEGRVLTGSNAQVRVHVLKDTLETGNGAAYFEGHPDAISSASAQRFSCGTETVFVDFDRGFAIDVGWDQRLFTKKQRAAIAARDGGCIFTKCDRPPSWTEVHHINGWAAEKGRTDTADGVLLCRHHHMLLHNNGWKITRVGTSYFLHAPDGEVTPLESKSPLYRQHGGGAPPAGPPDQSSASLKPTSSSAIAVMTSASMSASHSG